MSELLRDYLDLPKRRLRIEDVKRTSMLRSLERQSKLRENVFGRAGVKEFM